MQSIARDTFDGQLPTKTEICGEVVITNSLLDAVTNCSYVNITF